MSRKDNKRMLHVFDGSITDYEKRFLIDNMAIIVDYDTGTILKYGDIETSEIKKEYEEKYALMNEMGFDIQLITFDRYNRFLTIDEICTIVNYGMNSHTTSFLELFQIDKEQLKDRLKQLSQYGY